MLELIIIIGIWLFVKNLKKSAGGVKGNRKALDKPVFERVSERISEIPLKKSKRPSAKPNQPRKEQQMKFSWKDSDEDTSSVYRPVSSAPRKKASIQNIQERGQDIMNKVNQHIYGTDASKADLLLYKNYLEVERRTDIKKMARDMECTMYQVISDIRDFQQMGYFSNVIIDDDNYVIKYKDSPVRDRSQASGSYTKAAAKKAVPSKEDPIKKHEEHGSASVKLTDCDDCGTSPETRRRTNPYMTMPEHGLEIGYMTMTNDYTVNYMTMPEQGMEIHYNTIPDEIS